MDHRLYKVHNRPLTHVTNQPTKKPIQPNQQPKIPFQEHLNTALSKTEDQTLKISKHAQKRLDERNIQIDQTLLSKIEEKLSEAKQKGVKDSLIITSNAALVCSAENNTVITAMNRDEASTQIFTNINGTILLDV